MSASELRYRRLFESARDGILILDVGTGRISDVNPFLVELLGFSRADMIGKTVGELSPFKDIVLNQGMLERLQKDRYVRYEHLPLETRDGRKIAVEFVSNVYQAGDHEVIQCNIRDITERKRHELAEAQLSAIVEFSDDAIVGKDLRGVVTSWNAAAERLFGYSAGEMVGQPILRLIPTDRQHEETEILDRIRSGEKVKHFDTRRLRKDGSMVDISVTISPVKDRTGTIVGASKVARDITVRKEHEYEIERLSRLYEALSRINKAVVTLNGREELFAEICRVLVEIGKLGMAWVGWLDIKTRQVIPVAQWGDHLDYLSQATIYADDRPEGQGPTGTAIREGRNYICNDFKHDPGTLPWREAAEQVNFRSSACFAIRQGGVVCGAISVYSAETDFFKDKEIALLQEAAADISFALDNFVREAARRQAENELLWKTAFLEAQVDSSLDGILVVDDQGKKIFQNQRLNDLWKIPPEVAGNEDDSMQVKFVADRTKRPQQFIDRVVYLNTHPEEVSRDEVELIDGMVLDRFSSSVQDKVGKHYGRIWTFRDITEPKRIEARFRRLVDSNAQGVAFWNTQGQITEANAAFLNLVGYTRADLEAGPIDWLAMTPPEYADLDQRVLKELAATGICKPFEKEYIRKDGKRVWVLLGAAAFEDNPREGVCFVIDLTERKMLERQFRQAQKMESIGSLAGGVAHDFNNMLAATMMNLSLLQRDSALSPETQAIIEELIEEAERAANLTRQLLMFSRRSVMELKLLDFNELMINLLKMLSRLIGEHIVVKFNHRAGLPALVGDAGMIEQVIMNLAVNARDAMADGGELSISIEAIQADAQRVQGKPGVQAGPFLCLSVADNGCGMDEPTRQRIFEPFFSTKPPGKGTGLGLATVQGIVAQHKGWVEVESKVGQGATFKVFLPASTKLISKEPATIKLEAMQGRETILVVEDVISLRRLVSRSLRLMGYAVFEAENGRAAMTLWQQRHGEFDLLFSDMVMPEGLTGLDLAAKLRKDKPNLKVIISSGHGAEIADQSSLSARGITYLQKPYRMEFLSKVVRDCLDGRK